jgi:hypothetical protein
MIQRSRRLPVQPSSVREAGTLLEGSRVHERPRRQRLGRAKMGGEGSQDVHLDMRLQGLLLLPSKDKHTGDS